MMRAWANDLTLILFAMARMLLGGILGATPLWAQPGLPDGYREILATSQRSSYAYDFLGKLCNQVGHRLSGSPGAEAAVTMVADEMRRIGLTVHLQPIQVPVWVRGHEEACLTDYAGRPSGVFPELRLLALGGSSGTDPKGLEAEVLVVDSIEHLQSLADRVPGKFVLFNSRFDDRLAKQGHGGTAYGQAVGIRGRGPEAARKLGAAAALIRSVGGVSYRLPHTGATGFEGPPIPAAALSAEDAERIVYLAERGPVRMRLLLTCENRGQTTSYNVIGDLPGATLPDEYVIVSGHLDSWDVGTGALDDGAGVAVAMQTADTFRQLKLRPARSLRVIAWMNEENGLVGGRSYAQEFSQLRHFAALESDLGAGHPVGFHCRVDDSFMKRLFPLRALLGPLGAAMLTQSKSTGADISPLAEQGVPSFHPDMDSRTYFDYHHTEADTFDKVDPNTLRECATVSTLLCYYLCQLKP